MGEEWRGALCGGDTGEVEELEVGSGVVDL